MTFKAYKDWDPLLVSKLNFAIMNPAGPIKMTRRSGVLPSGARVWQVLEEDRDALLKTLCSMWGIAQTDRFPGATCISIEREHFVDLQSFKYWVCEKTDGVRYLMMCVVYKDLKLITLINRNFEIFLLGINVPTALFQGTILDGELVMNKKTERVEFLVFDAVCISGRSVRDLPFHQRIACPQEVLRPHPQPLSDAVFISGKAFFPLFLFSDFLKHREQHAGVYDTDGLIFTPDELPVWNFRHRKMFKWKDASKHTIDFLVLQDEAAFSLNLYDSLNKKMRKAAMLRTPTIGDYVIKPKDVVECKLEKAQWKPFLLRTDKSHPNDLETFRRTLNNIKENITLEEFSEVATKCIRA